MSQEQMYLLEDFPSTSVLVATQNVDLPSTFIAGDIGY